MRISIGQKLTISFLSMALLVGIVGIVGYSNMRTTINHVNAIAEEETPALIKLNEMKSNVLEAIGEAFAYPLLDNPQEKAAFYEKLDQFDTFAAEFEDIARIGQAGEEEETEVYKQMVAARQSLTIAASDMFENYERVGTADEIYFALLDDAKHRFITSMDRLLKIEVEEVLEAHQRIQSTIANAERLTLILVIAAIILAIVLGLLVSSSISRPIARLRSAALEFGKGNLGARTAVSSSDEIGQLARSFNDMAGALQHSRTQLEEKVNETEEAKRSLESEIVEREEVTAQLIRSNQDLEQFANIASHDLQEPLRMVSSYTQLLARRYKDKLDSEANEFIGYVVDGAKRMQSQINDLLAYSQINTQGNSFEATNCSDIFETALTNLSGIIEEKGATVTRESLPTLPADASQLVSVFQNLIGNGIKYHGDEPPRINVSAVRSKNKWLFSFMDNGIGIKSEFGERIFEIFQRLHSKTKYAGTGIGLAICKNVIERHGGRIWVESEPGKGSIFYFTIPAGNLETNHDGPGYNTIQTN